MIENLTPSILYVGVDDVDLDLFESQYAVPEGISYNSYVVLDGKVAVVDTVDARRVTEWRARLAEALGGRQPDYLVVQHLEPDHSGGIEMLMREFPEMKVVASSVAVRMMPLYVDRELLDGRTVTVKEGDSLSLGEHELKFVMAPMVHWPEVMVTLDMTDGVLFSADAFGKFGALSLTAGTDDWACEARRYYFNIVGKYGVPVQSLLGKLTGAPIRVIAPLHGPVLTENLAYYWELYDTWSSYRPETQGVLIAYASIHGNTAAAACRLAESLRDKGVRVSVMDLSRCDMAEAVEDAFKMDRMVVAASTYDGDIFPPMHKFLHHLQLKGFCNRKVAVVENGSWAPVAARKMRDMLSAMRGIEIVGPSVTIRGRMTPADESALEVLATALAGQCPAS